MLITLKQGQEAKIVKDMEQKNGKINPVALASKNTGRKSGKNIQICDLF